MRKWLAEPVHPWPTTERSRQPRAEECDLVCGGCERFGVRWKTDGLDGSTLEKPPADGQSGIHTGLSLEPPGSASVGDYLERIAKPYAYPGGKIEQYYRDARDRASR